MYHKLMSERLRNLTIVFSNLFRVIFSATCNYLESLEYLILDLDS